DVALRRGMKQRTRSAAGALAAGLTLAGLGGAASAWSGDAPPDVRPAPLAVASQDPGARWTLVDRESRQDKDAKKGKDDKDEGKGARAVKPPAARAPSQPAQSAPPVQPPAPPPAAPTAAPSPTPLPPTPTPDPNERVVVGAPDDRSAADELRRRLDAAALAPRQADALAAALGADLTGDRLRAMKVPEPEQL